MAKGDSPTRGRELNIHFGDVEDAELRRPDLPSGRHGAGDGRRHARRSSCGSSRGWAWSTSATAPPPPAPSTRGSTSPRCSAARSWSSSRTTATPTPRPPRKQCAAERLADKAAGYGIPGVRADGNDVLAVYQVTREAVERARARRGRDADRAHDLPPEGPRRARQPVATSPPARSTAGPGRTIRSTATSQQLTESGGSRPRSSPPIDERVQRRDRRRHRRSASVARARGARRADRRLRRSAGARRRSGTAMASDRAVDRHERPASWGTHDG